MVQMGTLGIRVCLLGVMATSMQLSHDFNARTSVLAAKSRHGEHVNGRRSDTRAKSKHYNKKAFAPEPSDADIANAVNRTVIFYMDKVTLMLQRAQEATDESSKREQRSIREHTDKIKAQSKEGAEMLTQKMNSKMEDVNADMGDLVHTLNTFQERMHGLNNNVMSMPAAMAAHRNASVANDTVQSTRGNADSLGLVQTTQATGMALQENTVLKALNGTMAAYIKQLAGNLDKTVTSIRNNAKQSQKLMDEQTNLVLSQNARYQESLETQLGLQTAEVESNMAEYIEEPLTILQEQLETIQVNVMTLPVLVGDVSQSDKDVETNCYDDNIFQDEQGYTCADWGAYICDDPQKQRHYSQAGAAAVQEHCCCESGDVGVYSTKRSNETQRF